MRLDAAADSRRPVQPEPEDGQLTEPVVDTAPLVPQHAAGDIALVGHRMQRHAQRLGADDLRQTGLGSRHATTDAVIEAARDARLRHQLLRVQVGHHRQPAAH